jgi:purine-nucleoside phosphorylase
LSWTTDAPYRETGTAIKVARSLGVCCVEMESAALYAFALARQQKIICYAHLTNTVAQEREDFEKGGLDSLAVLTHTIRTIWEL